MSDAAENLVQRVKARLLPLTHFAHFLERCVEILPRRVVPIRLDVTTEIEILDQDKGEYKAIGYSSAFWICSENILNSGGWFYLEAALVRHNGNRESFIRGTVSGRQEEVFGIFIPSNLRGSIREVFYLPRGATGLQWQPTAVPGYFSQSELLVHRITWMESFLRRVHRVLITLVDGRYRQAARQMGLTWKGFIFHLQRVYAVTAWMQVEKYASQDYAVFLEKNGSPNANEMANLRRLIDGAPSQPRISMLMHLEDADIRKWRETLTSVIAQLYANWELFVIGEDGQCDAWRGKVGIDDERIKIIPLEQGAGKATGFNRAIDTTQGDYICEIGQHDTLPMHALLHLAADICCNPDSELIYTDHDEISEDGVRKQPHFKPEWNPDLLTSHNYIASLCLYRLALIKNLGGYREGCTGAEAYDLVLRATQCIPENGIRHLAKVLYSKRNTSHARAQHGKDDATDQAHYAGKISLQERFMGSGVIVEDGLVPCQYRLRYPLPPSPPLVSIIIPTRDKPEILKKCVESIRHHTDYPNWEMMVVDNGSKDPEALRYLDEIGNDERICILRYDHPFNYSAINNFAARQARGEILALVNNDVEVITLEWLTEMVSHAIRPGIGAVGAKLLYSSGLVQHAGVVLGIGGVAGHVHRYLDDKNPGYGCRASLVQNYSAVTGACLVLRKEVYWQVGGLNETNLKIALNDVDLCLKLRQIGYRNLYTPYAKLYHHESISRGRDDTPEKHAVFLSEREYMKSSWGGLLNQDPAYNPNLTFELEDFSIRRLKAD